jgi:curli biogenesis system outer membrane secretion channel CsgG
MNAGFNGRGRGAALVFTALVLCSCGGSLQITRNPSASLASVSKVAVIPFGAAPAQGRITGEWETLLLSLGYRVVERDSIEPLLKEQGLSINGIVNPSEAPKIGELLGVDGLVLGRPNPREPYYSYTMTGMVRMSEPAPVSVKLLDAATARVVWSVSNEKTETLNVSREGLAVTSQLRRSLEETLRDGGWKAAKPAYRESSGAAIAFNPALRAEAGMRVGAYAFSGGNDNGDGGAWADKAAGMLLRAGYDIVDRQQLEKILKEQKSSLSGATRAQDMARLGKIAGLRAVLLGTAYGGQACAYHAKLVDVETGELYWSAYGEDCRLDQFSDLVKTGFEK